MNRFLLLGTLSLFTAVNSASAQTLVGLDIQLYAGLTITGAVSSVYQIQYVTDLAQTNNASAWRCLEFLQLPASPYLWADKSAPATAQRFYRASVFAGRGSPRVEATLITPHSRPSTLIGTATAAWTPALRAISAAGPQASL